MDFLSIKPIGERQAAINVAEGERQSKILQSEAVKIEQINEAQGSYSVSDCK
jgi:regulator of protease activity HflC (stomatin/prohibitin superfamily)